MHKIATITNPLAHFSAETMQLKGDGIVYTEKTIGQLAGIFHDEAARAEMDQHAVVYMVQAYLPVKPSTDGGLFFGTTTINPGTVHNEYFMTHGHFHEIRNRGEFYWGIQGEGVLLLMAPDRSIHTENIHAGSIHYVPGNTAHRVANTGNEPLVFNACWPSDAGHDYAEIITNGFSFRLVNNNGLPQLIQNT